MALYVGSLMTNKDRRESFHREEPPIVLDKGISSEDVHFTFIDIIPQVTNSYLGVLHSSRSNITYHNFSDLIKRANLWFLQNQDWRIVNCETVLLFFKQNDSGWHLAAENSCFTLDKGAQSSLMALRLWIRRLSRNHLSNGRHKTGHKANYTPGHRANERSKSNQNHCQFNHVQANHTTCSPMHNLEHHVDQFINHQYTNGRKSRKENSSETSSLELKNSDSESQENQPFILKFRDFVPENSEPGNHSKFEKLDQVVDKLNCAIRNDELLAENVITVESLYFPCDSDWMIDHKLELTLHSFPSNYICILRVFYVEKTKYDETNNNVEEKLSQKLRRLGYAFQIKLRDFIPRTLSKGNFFKKPEFEQQTTCIKRASQWIEQESKLHQIKFKNLIKQLGNEKLSDGFLFDFKNAQCIEVKTKVLKHNIDSQIMAHTSNSGDYIRIFRVAYMEMYDINSDQKTGEESVQVSSKSRKTTLLNKSKYLIKSKKLSKQSTANKSVERSIENNFDELVNEHNNSIIHLSSAIFTPNNSSTTIQEMKREIQLWSMTHCRDGQLESDELARYSRKPRLLSAETVEIFTKNFSTEQIERETENCFNFNRIGTMNNFLYFSFRIYLDYLDGGSNLNDANRLKLSYTDDQTNGQSKDDKCTIV